MRQIHHQILDYIRQNPGSTSGQVGLAVGIPSRAVDIHLSTIENDPEDGALFALDKHNRLTVYREGGFAPHYGRKKY